MKLSLLVVAFLFCTGAFAKSLPSPPPIEVEVLPSKAECMGFKIVDTDDLEFVELEYPNLIDGKLKPDGVVMNYHRAGKLLFTNFVQYSENTEKNSAYLIFGDGLDANDDTEVIISYRCDECPRARQGFTYRIESIKELYYAHKSNSAQCGSS